MAHRFTHAVLVVLLVFALLLTVLLLTVPTEDIHGAPGFMYGIVLDAGSSHTSLFIYKWPADKENGTGVVTQHSECHVKGGGISSYAGQQGAAGRCLEGCLDQALTDIPKEKHHLTPVYLGATAGMRLLQLSSPEQASQILQEVSQKIQSYPFNYRGASVLSGQEEGAYGWVTVNYLSENFLKYGFVGRWLNPSRPTVGALDLGGASTQITFETRDEIEDAADMIRMRLYGYDYSVYTHSFLCYGQGEVLRRLLAHLIKSQGYSASIVHPCYPVDHSTTIKMNSVFNSPCSEKYKAPNDTSQSSLTISGGGDYPHCVGNLSEIFSFDGCRFSQCSFDNVFQPNVTGSFVAFSAFFYIHSFLEQITGTKVSTPSQLERAAKTVCQMTYNEMLVLAPEYKVYLEDYCAVSVFVKILMLRGYSFDETTFQHISFQKKVGDASVGWALGYMLALSNLLPAEVPGRNKCLKLEVWGFLLFILVFMLVATPLLTVIWIYSHYLIQTI
uniref:Ectonucleoside triphosphate diphosphohydrolase 2 n=1 Tax=Tetraodon nigroviridis TaxID=99883 RepID=H3CHH8_TETNG